MNMFILQLSPQEILAIGRPTTSSNTTESDNVFSVSTVKSPVLSLSSLMPPKILDLGKIHISYK